MVRHGIRELISILMESPLYMTLSVAERRVLVSQLAENYPSLVEGRADETEIGYEASWAGIIKKP
jgi:hypothetical protein